MHKKGSEGGGRALASPTPELLFRNRAVVSRSAMVIQGGGGEADAPLGTLSAAHILRVEGNESGLVGLPMGAVSTS